MSAYNGHVLFTMDAHSHHQLLVLELVRWSQLWAWPGRSVAGVLVDCDVAGHDVILFSLLILQLSSDSPSALECCNADGVASDSKESDQQATVYTFVF